MTRRGMRDWFDLMLADHGFLRLAIHNLHEIRPGVWRCNQPTPGRIHKIAARHKIKTVINLRGPRSDGGWRLEKEACDERGIDLVDFSIRSRAVPSRDTVLAARDLFKRVEYPILMHCKSGADRAGIMAALYLLLMENASPSEAAKQLSLKYYHFRYSKTGLLDAFIAAYAKAKDKKKNLTFIDWVKKDFAQEAITRDFKSRKWASLLVDDILGRE